IVGVAAGAGQFNTLVAAVKAAGLVDTLNGKGPFTVFAPTDEAFAKLPAGTVENLLKPENKQKLAAVLTYHVLAGKVMAADVTTSKPKSVNGKELAIKVDAGKVTVGSANVIKTDIAASNGVIHVIDTVLIP
ncbi:MAG: fasciclin domain-containing protein, partial [Verrucomicrobiota bacterium]